MVDLNTMFKDGGFFMWVILLTAILHLVVLVIQARKRKTLDLTPVLWSLCAAIVIVGLLGKLNAIVMTEHVVTHAPDEMKQVLLAGFISAELYTVATSIIRPSGLNP